MVKILVTEGEIGLYGILNNRLLIGLYVESFDHSLCVLASCLCLLKVAQVRVECAKSAEQWRIAQKAVSLWCGKAL